VGLVADNTITWKGKSGTEYTYWIYPFGTTFQDEPGNYMFIKETQPKKFWPIYIGETESLADRLNNPEAHHKWACTKREGATHLCARINKAGEKVRRAEEQDLIEAYGPICND
jgi:hypothetical protein